MREKTYKKDVRILTIMHPLDKQDKKTTYTTKKITIDNHTIINDTSIANSRKDVETNRLP